jgi:flagella basal body P-ring formation protein FlgA
VRCAGDKPWKVYLPVDVIVTETVLVASRTLPRGHILSVDDVNPQRRDVSRLLSGYISDVGSLSGHQLKTQILAGKILTPAMLQAETAIRRGQTVTLIVGTGLLSIRTSGTALADGALKQRIRVKNTHSGRIVEGIVRSREDVEVLLPQSHNISTATPKVSPNLADTGSSNNDR